jgi:predicted amidophosphoribosyltransferase
MLHILAIWTCLVDKGWLLKFEWKFKLYMFWEKLTFLSVGRCIQCMEHAYYMQYICENMVNKLNQHYTSICNKPVNAN